MLSRTLKNQPLAPKVESPKAPAAGLRRHVELLAIISAAVLMLVTGHRLVGAPEPLTPWQYAAALAFGFCAADVCSGIVHWAADSYGHAKMPGFGGFVRTFREHHQDKMAITRHDFIETNGDVCLFGAPVHALFVCWVDGAWGLTFVFALFGASYCNSQFHQWAHQRETSAVVRRLQRLGLILAPEHHARHHSGSHQTHYCITSGSMNRLLDRTRFFRLLEWVLAALGVKRAS